MCVGDKTCKQNAWASALISCYSILCARSEEEWMICNPYQILGSWGGCVPHHHADVVCAPPHRNSASPVRILPAGEVLRTFSMTSENSSCHRTWDVTMTSVGHHLRLPVVYTDSHSQSNKNGMQKRNSTIYKFPGTQFHNLYNHQKMLGVQYRY